MLPTANLRRQAADPSISPAGPLSNDVDLDTLAKRIAQLAAGIHAATYRLLVLIAEFDRRDGWASGFRTCAHWLSWRTGIDLGAAREKVRVARALELLPRVSDGIRRGELSYAKVRAITRVATPENEEEMLAFAHSGTAAHVERLVRAWRRLDRAEEQEEEQIRHERRSLTLRPDHDGMWKLEGRLNPEVGAVLLRALEAGGDALFRKAEEDPQADSSQAADSARRPTSAQRFADAVGLIAERALGAGLAGDADGPASSPHRADRYQVVLHVEESDLSISADPGGGDLEDGVRVSAETSRRLSCDSSKVVMKETRDGDALNIGRRTRTIPPAIRRALDRRDGGCRFPGCGVRFTDAHHVRHWADGGETRLDNLVLLCRMHHRAVHEEGFGVEMAEGQPRFSRPDGRGLPAVPRSSPMMSDVIALFPREHPQECGAFDSTECSAPDSPMYGALDSTVSIKPWDDSTLWDGVVLDLDLALNGLRGCS